MKPTIRIPALLLVSLSLVIGCARSGEAPAPQEPAPQAAEKGTTSVDDKVDAEGADMDEEEAAEAPEPGSETGGFEHREDKESEKKEGPFDHMSDEAALSKQLNVQIAGLDDALGGTKLSCSGAGPFRDAICSIADRICELGDVSKKCVEAKQSCQRAKKRFDAKCH